MSIGHAWDPAMFEGVHALTTPIRTTDPSDYRKALIMSTAYDRAELSRLADDMHRQDFDHVWTVDADLHVIDGPSNVYAPDVSHDPDGDVSIDGAGEWEALTGMTGQYSYNGAVMHPSESYGRGMAERIAEMCDDAREDGKTVVVAHVEVRDDDGDFPEGDPIGWAVVYRTI